VTHLWPIALVGFAISLGLTPVTRRLARRFGLLDQPGGRKAHAAPTPLLGGLAIYGAFILALLAFPSWPQHILELGAILAGATWLALVGLIDDRNGLSPRTKFPAQFLAAFVVLASGITIDLTHSIILNDLITVLWIVGIINALNFLDNMDGLAAGVSAIAAAGFFLLAVSQGQELVSALSASLCGAAIGFLIYNFNPASTFMGDMGSMVLGFVLSVVAIKLHFYSKSTVVTWMIPVLVLGLPLFDTSLVVVTRLREGRSPFVGGRDHTSHRLVSLGLSPKRAVVVLYGVCVLLGICALIVSQADVTISLWIGTLVGVIALAAFVSLILIRQRQAATPKRVQPNTSDPLPLPYSADSPTSKH